MTGQDWYFLTSLFLQNSASQGSDDHSHTKDPTTFALLQVCLAQDLCMYVACVFVASEWLKLLAVISVQC